MLRTVDEVVTAFGGPTAMSEWTGLGVTAIHNWIARGEIPPCWHLKLICEGARRKFKIHPDVFGLEEDDAKQFARIFRPVTGAVATPA